VRLEEGEQARINNVVEFGEHGECEPSSLAGPCVLTQSRVVASLVGPPCELTKRLQAWSALHHRAFKQRFVVTHSAALGMYLDRHCMGATNVSTHLLLPSLCVGTFLFFLSLSLSLSLSLNGDVLLQDWGVDSGSRGKHRHETIARLHTTQRGGLLLVWQEPDTPTFWERPAD
jgi:hypothetical protein